MHPYNLLNALYDTLVQFMRLLWIILTIVMLPVSFIAALTMDLNDAAAYIRYIVHYRLNRLREYGFTVKVIVRNNIPQIHLQHYDDDVNDVNTHIKEMKFPSTLACIRESLAEASKYSFVIFQSDSVPSTFIQLHTNAGLYVMELPLTPYTQNSEHAVNFIKLLRTQGYKKTAPRTFYRNKTYTIEEINPKLTLLNANLGSDREHAAAICNTVFTKLFKTKIIPEVIVG